jgi:glycosyltransferase involved in cell wall biosynthesis
MFVEGGEPAISVIVPARDAAATLGVLFESLARQTFSQPWELILADNGSTDGTVDVALSFASRLPLRVLDASQVAGTAHARNVGARYSRSGRLAFVDADDEVDAAWLEAIATALGEHDAVASRFETARLNTPEVRAARHLSQESKLGEHRSLVHAGGSGLAVRRRVHESIGGFDEGLLRLEDTDYCWRLQFAGHDLHFEPNAVVHVRFRTSVRASMRQAFGYGRFDGHLYHRYAAKGLVPHVPFRDSLKGVGMRVVRVLRPSTHRARSQSWRSLANHVGFLLGRLELPARERLGLGRRRGFGATGADLLGALDDVPSDHHV